MGFFGRFVFAGREWTEENTDADEYLAIDVHDSSVATVDYAPVLDDARGRCFLGYEPRIYFDDETANEPVDPAAEAQALVAWAERRTGATPSSASIEALLADPRGTDPDDVFVEETAGRLVLLLGLPPLPI